jgi:polyisoprenoid-binding protein YceI
MSEKWNLDPAGHEVTIKHKTMWGLATVRGVFKTVRAEGVLDADGTGQGTVTVDSGSIDTGNTKRDTHLRSADFFDIEKHPSFQFVVDTIGPVAAQSSETQVKGTLTVRETVKPLTFLAHAERHADAVTVTAAIPYTRADFGMTWNQLGMMAPGGEIAVKLRFTRQA